MSTFSCAIRGLDAKTLEKIIKILSTTKKSKIEKKIKCISDDKEEYHKILSKIVEKDDSLEQYFSKDDLKAIQGDTSESDNDESDSDDSSTSSDESVKKSKSKKVTSKSEPKKKPKIIVTPKKKGGGNPFIVFSGKHRDEIKKKNPEATFGEIGKLLGAKWKKLSDGEKAKYKV
jgi:hypothetical protein